jgi:predicted RNA-binding Zn-ribbon protein involved in translation (DUF1610 family)
MKMDTKQLPLGLGDVVLILDGAAELDAVRTALANQIAMLREAIMQAQTEERWELAASLANSLDAAIEAQDSIMRCTAPEFDVSLINNDGPLPCPFCAMDQVESGQDNWDLTFYVRCPNCFASITRDEEADDLDALTAWNTRVQFKGKKP